MMIGIKRIIVAFGLVLLVWLEATDGTCCGTWSEQCPAGPDGAGESCTFYTYKTCGDGRYHHSPCCGKGPCNIFCCNCDGGCLGSTAPGFTQSDNTTNAIARYQALDQNNDKKIDQEEFKKFLSTDSGVQQLSGHVEQLEQLLFESVDVDKNGAITIEEFDKDAAAAQAKVISTV